MLSFKATNGDWVVDAIDSEKDECSAYRSEREPMSTVIKFSRSHARVSQPTCPSKRAKNDQWPEGTGTIIVPKLSFVGSALE